MWVTVSHVCCCRKYYLLGPCKSWPYSVFRLQSLEVGDDNYSHQVLFLKDLNLPKPDKWVPAAIIHTTGTYKVGEEELIHDFTMCATMCK